MSILYLLYAINNVHSIITLNKKYVLSINSVNSIVILYYKNVQSTYSYPMLYIFNVHSIVAL